MREVCGSVSGMVMLAGLIKPANDPSVKEWRTANYALVQEMAERFKEINGSILCKELLGLVPMGSASNAPKESPEPSDRTAEYYKKRPCVELVRIAAKIAENAEYDGVLMVTPYYNKTTQNGLVEHFTYVADRIKIPMILYNVPSRTGIGISTDTYRVLSQHPNINGIKEASGDISLFSTVRCQCGDDLHVWC